MMTNRRYFWALRACVPLWAMCACARSGGAGDYAGRLDTEVERQTVPPGVTGLSVAHSDHSACAIRTQWTFTSSWNHEKYVAWVKAQLSPGFTAQLDSPYQMTFARHEGGDAHSLLVEMPSVKDSLVVRVTLCVYPD